MDETFDVAVVGGGIVGLASAWAAQRSGKSVVLFERSKQAHGASVRNFGMVWPIGQTPGQMFDIAMRSRELWLQLKQKTGLWINECGSLHLARHEDEVAVLEEFVQQDSRASELRLLTPDEVQKRSPAAKIDGLKAALWSPFELCVNPPKSIAHLTDWLSKQPNIDIRCSTAVREIAGTCVNSNDGRKISAQQILVCSGHDFETLFPEVFASSGLRKCKLQMLATGPQPNDWKLGPHLAGGLTLRHYQSFENCPSLPALRQRIGDTKPKLDEYGIHVMASQNDQGEIILGDSHVYDDDAMSPFDSAEIDRLILDELRELIQIPDFNLQRRWHGVYAKNPAAPAFVERIDDHCRIVTGLGGAGMTLSFGLAEQVLQSWDEPAISV